MNKNLGLYLQVGGVVLGAITALLLVTRHPVLVGLLALGAALYFVGEYVKKL
jgi:hypothetical protein